MTKELDKLTVEELFELISPSSEVMIELRRRKVLRTKNVVGEIGEFFAIKFYNKLNEKEYVKTKKLPKLLLATETTKNIDALSREGKIYSIKCVSSKKGTTGSFWDPESIKNNNPTFHFLIIVILDDKYNVDSILELTWDDFFKNKKYNKRMNNFNISLTKKIRDKFTVIYKK